MPKRLVIATHNQGKAGEIKSLLGQISWIVTSLEKFNNICEATEDSDTYAGNAIAKAKYYSRSTGEWALADDSGLEVAALGGAPGVLSARYAGPNATDAERRSKVLLALSEINLADKRARFVCSAAIANPWGEIVKITEGVCEGFICDHARGESGFGYDPIFVPTGFDLTFGELSDEIKNRISHRAQAILAMRSFLMSER